MQPYELILKSEELFAREVALAVVVTRPLKSWLYIVPGMFIVDFLRRQRSIRRYTDGYMFPRRQALHGAQAILEGAAQDEVRERIASELAAGHHHQTELADRLTALIDLLIGHYHKLLTATGADYPQLLRNAYKDRAALASVLTRLDELERHIDGCVADTAEDDDQQHRIAVRQQVVMRRTRLIDTVF